jgi:hypothetical protein
MSTGRQLFGLVQTGYDHQAHRMVNCSCYDIHEKMLTLC